MRNFSFSGRRHRDRPSGHADLATDFMDSALAFAESGWRGSFKTSQRAGPAEGERRSVEAVIAGGHRWLVFPKAFESAFQAETAGSRCRLLVICALIGMAAFWIGSMADHWLLSDLGELQSQGRVWIMLLMMGSVAVTFLIPASVKKSWHYEALTLFNTLVLNASLVLVGVLSNVTTAFTHTQCVVLVVMYAGLAARQRFWWTLAGASLTILAYVALVKGRTPLQDLIVDQNIKLMLLAFFFTLGPNYAFEYGERRAWLLRQLDAKRRAALVETGERLRLLSQRDPLTGLYNRRHFDMALRGAWENAGADGQPLAALMVDVDYFKLYNDTHGHPAGDACLERIADVLKELAQREGGVAARLGGEEFAVLLPGRSAEQALAVATLLNQAVRKLQIEHQASKVAPHVTVSVGVASARLLDPQAPPDLLRGADQALYEAKTAGRDRADLLDDSALTSVKLAATQDDQPQADLAQADGGQPLPSSADLERVLIKDHPFQRFPQAIEAEYQQQQAPNRRRHLFFMAWLGLLCINAYAFHSRPMFPDVSDDLMFSMLKVSVILGCLTPLLLAPLPGWLREMLYTEGICVMALTMIYIVSHSAEITTYSFLTSLLFLPLFAGVVGRQSVLCTVVTVVTTLGFAMFFLQPRDMEQTLVYRDTMFMVSTACLFTLVAAYTQERGARWRWLLREMERLDQVALTVATRRLHELSMKDPLTGLSNRRRFEADFARAWSQSQQGGRALSLLIIDVDYFKLFNDGHGHPAGDACLQMIARVLAGAAQTSRGFSARLGGEEFALILPGSGAAQAKRVGEQICAAVREANVEHRDSRAAGRVTISIGVACSSPQLSRARDLLAAADEAVYQAKAAGRDCCTLHQPV